MKTTKHLYLSRNQAIQQSSIPLIKNYANLTHMKFPKLNPPYASKAETTRVIPNSSKININKLKTIYGQPLRKTTPVRKIQLSPKISPLITQYATKSALTPLNKYPTRVIPMDLYWHKYLMKEYIKLDNGSKKFLNIDNSQNFTEKYIERAQILTKESAEKEIIGQLFIELFDELITVFPDYEKLFSSMKCLAQTLKKKRFEKNKSMAVYKTEFLNYKNKKPLDDEVKSLDKKIETTDFVITDKNEVEINYKEKNKTFEKDEEKDIAIMKLMSMTFGKVCEINKSRSQSVKNLKQLKTIEYKRLSTQKLIRNNLDKSKSIHENKSDKKSCTSNKEYSSFDDQTIKEG